MKTQIFIVWANAGRHSGHAAVVAKSKTEANRIMRASDWLDFGVVRPKETMTLEEYEADMGPDSIEPHELARLTKIGSWVELEWGT
jgi:hypothetical protein